MISHWNFEKQKIIINFKQAYCKIFFFFQDVEDTHVYVCEKTTNLQTTYTYTVVAFSQASQPTKVGLQVCFRARADTETQHPYQLCEIQSSSVLSMGKENEWIAFFLKEQWQSRPNKKDQKIQV